MEEPTKNQVETVAKSWKHGASMTSAAEASGLPLAAVSKLYALWDVHKRRSPAPPRKPSQTPKHPE
jgi:hypothetical protein